MSDKALGRIDRDLAKAAEVDDDGLLIYRLLELAGWELAFVGHDWGGVKVIGWYGEDRLAMGPAGSAAEIAVDFFKAASAIAHAQRRSLLH